MDRGVDSEVAAIAAIGATPTILEVVCRTTGMGFAAIARVTEDRWIACAVRDEIDFGLKPGGELPIATTICNEIRGHGRAVVIDRVADDPYFRAHPTPAQYGFESYISVPIRLANGEFYGTLCAIDPRPARLDTPAVRGMFTLFADLIGFHLDTVERLEKSEMTLAAERRRLASSEAALLDARQTAELREQFIAVLGHDLRNPLASIQAGVAMLEKTVQDERSAGTLALIHGSARRMGGLISNLMDFARGRLGGGLILERGLHDAVPVLNQVVDELRGAWPGRGIETFFWLDEKVNCDPARLGQLVSNLVANALAHGAGDAPVRVEAMSGGGQFQISVSNAGEQIPEAVMERLFQPFFRHGVQSTTEGLGLGLYIASEIARAHGGELRAVSTPAETRFSLTMPSA